MPRIPSPERTKSITEIRGPVTTGERSIPLDITSGGLKALGQVGDALSDTATLLEQVALRKQKQDNEDTQLAKKLAGNNIKAELFEVETSLKPLKGAAFLDKHSELQKARKDRAKPNLLELPEDKYPYHAKKMQDLGADNAFVQRANIEFQSEMELYESQMMSRLNARAVTEREVAFKDYMKGFAEQGFVELSNGGEFVTLDQLVSAIVFETVGANPLSEQANEEMLDELIQGVTLKHVDEQFRQKNVIFAQSVVDKEIDEFLMVAHKRDTATIDKVHKVAESILSGDRINKGVNENSPRFLSNSEEAKKVTAEISARTDLDEKEKASVLSRLETMKDTNDERDAEILTEGVLDEKNQIQEALNTGNKEQALAVLDNSTFISQDKTTQAKMRADILKDEFNKGDPVLTNEIINKLYDPEQIDDFSDRAVDGMVADHKINSAEGQSIKKRRKELKEGTNSKNNSQLRQARTALATIRTKGGFIIPEDPDNLTNDEVRLNEKRWTEFSDELELRVDEGEDALVVLKELTKTFDEENTKVLIDKFDGILTFESTARRKAAEELTEQDVPEGAVIIPRAKTKKDGKQVYRLPDGSFWSR